MRRRRYHFQRPLTKRSRKNVSGRKASDSNETDYPQRQRGAFLRSKYAPQRNAEAYDYPDGIGKEKQGNRVVNGGLPPETELRNLSGSTPKVLHGIAVGSRGQVPHAEVSPDALA